MMAIKQIRFSLQTANKILTSKVLTEVIHVHAMQVFNGTGSQIKCYWNDFLANKIF